MSTEPKVSVDIELPACGDPQCKMEAEIDALKAKLRILAAEVDEVRADRDRLREALKRYGQHAENCDVERLREPTRRCNCGLSSALHPIASVLI